MLILNLFLKYHFMITKAPFTMSRELMVKKYFIDAL